MKRNVLKFRFGPSLPFTWSGRIYLAGHGSANIALRENNTAYQGIGL